MLRLNMNVRSDLVKSALNTCWSSLLILIVTAGSCELMSEVILYCGGLKSFSKTKMCDWKLQLALLACVGWLVDPYIAGALKRFTAYVDAPVRHDRTRLATFVFPFQITSKRRGPGCSTWSVCTTRDSNPGDWSRQVSRCLTSTIEWEEEECCGSSRQQTHGKKSIYTAGGAYDAAGRRGRPKRTFVSFRSYRRV